MQEGILNLTQHVATAEQLKDGVVEPLPEFKEKTQNFLTFNDIPNSADLALRAYHLTDIASFSGFAKVMIAGAPYLMSFLEKELKSQQIAPVYSFSKRESVEVTIGDRVEKKSVFKHAGWIEV